MGCEGAPVRESDRASAERLKPKFVDVQDQLAAKGQEGGTYQYGLG